MKIEFYRAFVDRVRSCIDYAGRRTGWDEQLPADADHEVDRFYSDYLSTVCAS